MSWQMWATLCIPYLLPLFSLSEKAHLIRCWLPIVIFFPKATLSASENLFTNRMELCGCKKSPCITSLSVDPGFCPAVVSLDKTSSLLRWYFGLSRPPSDFWYRIPFPCMNLPFFCVCVSVGFTTSCQRWRRKGRKRKGGLYHKPTDWERRSLKRYKIVYKTHCSRISFIWFSTFTFLLSVGSQ